MYPVVIPRRPVVIPGRIGGNCYFFAATVSFIILRRLIIAINVVPATRIILPIILKSCTKWKMTQENRLDAKSSAPPRKPSGILTAASPVFA